MKSLYFLICFHWSIYWTLNSSQSSAPQKFPPTDPNSFFNAKIIPERTGEGLVWKMILLHSNVKGSVRHSCTIISIQLSNDAHPQQIYGHFWYFLEEQKNAHGSGSRANTSKRRHFEGRLRLLYLIDRLSWRRARYSSRWTAVACYPWGKTGGTLSDLKRRFLIASAKTPSEVIWPNKEQTKMDKKSIKKEKGSLGKKKLRRRKEEINWPFRRYSSW